MLEGRRSGILCHITSLPNNYGIGELGQEAYNFIDFLADGGQTYWQVLPITEPGASFSPYQSVSMFGCNPYLLSVELLYEDGFIDKDYFDKYAEENKNNTDFIDFKNITRNKKRLLQYAAVNFIDNGYLNCDDYKSFCEENSFWLDDYALFMAIRDKYEGAVWSSWETGLRKRHKSALEKAKKNLKKEIDSYKIYQYWFNSQWELLRKKAKERGIKIIGDMPMYPDYDSVTVWANKKLFFLDKEDNPAYVAGVPPDYFCADGQYWSNPFYNWKTLKKTNYEFFMLRFKEAFKKFDIVRIDHFRAFSEAWKIKANEERSAIDGEWYNVPGYDLLSKVKEQFPNMPVIAEDLGEIDDKVRKLRDDFGLPGMSILQFAFDSPDSLYLPHNQVKNRVVYTGTHDNNTTLGWWNSLNEDIRSYVRRYLNIDGNDISWQMITSAFQTCADTVIIPLQDVLQLGEEHRMNVPGVVNDQNWTVKFNWNMVKNEDFERLKEITGLYCRFNN